VRRNHRQIGHLRFLQHLGRIQRPADNLVRTLPVGLLLDAHAAHLGRLRIQVHRGGLRFRCCDACCWFTAVVVFPTPPFDSQWRLVSPIVPREFG
jgi:hypothetical protein